MILKPRQRLLWQESLSEFKQYLKSVFDKVLRVDGHNQSEHQKVTNKTTKSLAVGIKDDVNCKVQDKTEDNITAIMSPVLIILSVS